MNLVHLLRPWTAAIGRGRRSLWFGALAVVAIALVAAACGGGDDDDQAQAGPASQATAQAPTQADERSADQPAPAADADADADADNVREIRPVEAEPDGADSERRVRSRDEDDDGPASGRVGSGAVTAGVLSEALGIDVSSGRFSLEIMSDITIDALDGDPEFAELSEIFEGLLADITLEGAFSAEGNIELSIMTGPTAIIPSLNLVVVDDEIYTNFGFGWMQGTEALVGLAGLLGDDFDLGALDFDTLELDTLDLDDFDFDFDGLDLGELDLGSLTLDGAPAELLDRLEEVGTENVDGRPARHLRGPFEELLEDEATTGIPLSIDRLVIDVWVDVETEVILRLAIDGSNLEIEDVLDAGGLSVGSFLFDMTIDPASGLPTSLVLEITGLATDDLDGSGAIRGDLFFSLEITDLNAAIVIEAPPVSR